jgi:hypothetical protein
VRVFPRATRHLEVVVKRVVASREIILNSLVTRVHTSGSKPTPMPFNFFKPKGVGCNGEKRWVFHHWERFNSHEGFSKSQEVTVR